MGGARAREEAGGGLLCSARWRRGKPRQKAEGASKDSSDRVADKDWCRDCKEPCHQEHVHLAHDDEEEPVLLMAQVCAINAETED